jgi:hypothetical protein
MVRNPWGVIGLSIITLGIYFIYWQYVTFRDLKNSSGEGIGGGLGLVFAIFIPIVNSFMLPSEVGHGFQRQGKTPPMTGLTGFWLFLPLAGWFVWVIKVQGRLNEYWNSSGLAPLGSPIAAPLGWTPPPYESAAPTDGTFQSATQPTQTGSVPPAPGYWQASDGNWYPPEQRPGTPPPPAAPVASPYGATTAPIGETFPSATQPAPPAPGYWQASDGNWYPPPEQRPGTSPPGVN